MAMLRAYLSGASAFDSFYKRFYFYFVDEIHGDALSEADWEFFGAIHDKLDFVAETVDPISRADGWISAKEFKQWLRDYLGREQA